MIECEVVNPFGDLDFEVLARLNGQEVGSMTVMESPDPGVLVSFVHSSISGMGIPRALLTNVTRTIQDVCTDLGVSAIHEETFGNPGARKHLPGLYEQFGYVVKTDEGVTAVREYYP